MYFTPLLICLASSISGASYFSLIQNLTMSNENPSIKSNKHIITMMPIIPTTIPAAKLKEPVRNPPNPVNAATNPTRKPKTRYITNAFILLVGYTIASLIISLKFISYSPFTALTSLYVAYME